MTSTKQQPDIFGPIYKLSYMVNQIEQRDETGGVFPREVVEPVLGRATKTAERLGDVTSSAFIELLNKDCTENNGNEPLVFSTVVAKAVIELAMQDIGQQIQKKPQ